MKDLYKKLLKVSLKDVESISHEDGINIQSSDKMAMMLFQYRVRKYHMKAMDQGGLDFPDDESTFK